MRRLLLMLALIASTGPAVSHAEYLKKGEIKILPNRILILFKPEITTSATRAAIVEQMGGKVIDQLDYFGIVLAAPGIRPAAAFKAAMAVRPEVMAVQNDFIANWLLETPAYQPTLSELTAIQGRIRSGIIAKTKPPRRRPGRPGTQDGEEAQWGVKKVNAPAAWPTNQGAGVKVAVVDTGIDASHPELAGAVAGGYNAVEKEKPWADDHFHGTHVAGIIAAALDGKGVVGVAPKAKLYAVKVLTKEGSGSMFGILDGMQWCATNKMDVANMSLGAPQGNFIFEWGVKQMVGGNVALIAAAGNGDGNGGPSPVNFPAAYPEAIAVSALQYAHDGQAEGITPWSSRGPEVDFIAPGYKVPSSVPLWHDATGVKAYSGTSMATPHVSGLAALAVARGASSPEAVRAALKAAATPLGIGAELEGSGLINAAKLK